MRQYADEIQMELARGYVDSLKGQLELFYLPPYSPQLNPDERA